MTAVDNDHYAIEFPGCLGMTSTVFSANFGKVLFFLAGRTPFSHIKIRPRTRTSVPVSLGLLSFPLKYVEKKKKEAHVMKL